MIPSTLLMYGCKSGQILLWNTEQTEPSILCSIETMDSPLMHEYAKSFHIYRENSLALVGTSNGRLLILNLISHEIEEDITAKQTLKLSEINKILVSGSHSFYTLHERYIV